MSTKTYDKKGKLTSRKKENLISKKNIIYITFLFASCDHSNKYLFKKRKVDINKIYHFPIDKHALKC